MGEKESVFEAYIDAFYSITIIVPKSYDTEPCTSFTLQDGDRKNELTVTYVSDIIFAVKYECNHPYHIELGADYQIIDQRGNSTPLKMGAVMRSQEFDERYRYTDNDLGITYTSEKTTWKVWAPTASAVRLRVHKDYIEEYMMTTRSEQGVWSFELYEDCDEYKYTYLLCINQKWRETSDPYSISVTANSTQSIVVDLAKTRRVSPPKTAFSKITDAIIYEAHIRDLTIQDEQLQFRGKYKGLVETATKEKEIGIPYLKELGITHLQLLPFNDFGGVSDDEKDTTYNWGYNPVHFNTPEGWYSTKPADPYQLIDEVKELITTLHENDIRVIMDVVYNHIYIYEDCSFGKTVPGYYFRYDQHGLPSNGTGVGNDIASERYMARKFIVDSVAFWAREYGIDGFRFDLMSILDVDTMNQIRKAVDEINPNIILLGEGWDLNTPLAYEDRASNNNAKKMSGVALFNDFFRDTIKGSIFEIDNKGYALGNTYVKEQAKSLLLGNLLTNSMKQATYTNPEQVVNYVECHDNYTMWDKIMISNKWENDGAKRKRHSLATAFVLLSQGIAFLHAGQEFFRTKKGVEDSYQSPDEINQLDWQRRDTFQENADYVKGLIQLRKSHAAFRFTKSEDVEKHITLLELDDQIIGYQLKNVGEYGKWQEILVYFHTGLEPFQYSLAEQWTVVVYGQEVNINGLFQVGSFLELLPMSATVLVR